ncbi:UNVERIFIED_CONTAM: DEAD-box ATP-dependent RNA helicase FANCM [Sesamum radiatum]|uniref:DEAD-box ATP-dependent RNA helicase FANCM n=1 Tax=Sesamum radiatum TaxID=300843 RepID=A0AAW2M7K8_SESRA
MASNDEEDDQDNSSYEDSFIDDGANPTSAGTQAGLSKTDMMAIYRRSLLSQSPFQGLPNFATNFSPDSVVQSSRINESGSSSGTKHDPTPQTGLESTARNSQLACLEIPSEMADSKLESRKRKLSFYQAQSVPTVNLDKEFSLISEAPGKNSAVQIQAEKTEENRDIFEDDQFYEGIDLDAVEEEAAKLLRYKTDCSTQQTANVSEPIQHNLGVLGSPSFDLGF